MASRERDDAMTGLLKRNLAGDAGAGNDCLGPDIPRPISSARSTVRNARMSRCTCRNARAAENSSPHWAARKKQELRQSCRHRATSLAHPGFGTGGGSRPPRPSW